MVIVYIETNLLIGLTLGQEPEAVEPLDEAGRNSDLRLAIPSICFMEATATIKSRIHEWVELRRRLVAEATQVERDRKSAVARELLDRLNDAQTTIDEYANGIMADFQEMIQRVRSTARMIPLSKTTLGRGFSSIIVEARHQGIILPDNLIIHCIPNDARSRPATSKAFLGGNSSDFSRPAVLSALKAAGIDKYFAEAKNALGRYRSRPAS